MFLGWKNSITCPEERHELLTFERRFESETIERVNALESELIETLKSIGANRLFAWAELERIRSRNAWKPIGRLSELANEEETFSVSSIFK